MLYQFILVLHTIIALAIIVLVFLQHGKGADIGAAFGSGASNTVFGSKGSGGPLYKMTGALALMFCITSVSLTAILAKDKRETLSISSPVEIDKDSDSSSSTNSTLEVNKDNDNNNKAASQSDVPDVINQ